MKNTSNRAVEFEIVAIASVVTYSLSVQFDLMELIFTFSQDHEGWEIDELIMVSMSITLCSLYFLLKRNREFSILTKKLEAQNDQLSRTLGELEVMQGIIPICSHCKCIRDDEGYWERVETYIAKHSGARFSHGVCPDCLKEHYPNIDLKDPS